MQRDATGLPCAMAACAIDVLHSNPGVKIKEARKCGQAQVR